MTRDPPLPVRLVDGAWTTEGAGSAAVPTNCQPGIMALGRGAEWPCSVTLPPRPATDYARAFAEYNRPPAPRSIFAAVALDGSGVWAIGDSEDDARRLSVDRREDLRERGGDDSPDASTDAAWSAALAIVTMSGTTAHLRLLVSALGDDVALWSPDLWTDPEPTKEP